MKTFAKIACIIEFILVVTCGIFEFVPVSPVLRTIMLTLTGLYSLAGLVYFSLIKK